MDGVNGMFAEVVAVMFVSRAVCFSPFIRFLLKCKINYNIHWEKSKRHCPNLVSYPSNGKKSKGPVSGTLKV